MLTLQIKVGVIFQAQIIFQHIKCVCLKLNQPFTGDLFNHNNEKIQRFDHK